MVLGAVIVVAQLLAANPLLEEGRALLDSMQYEQAQARLEEAAKVSGTSQAERRELTHLLVRALAAQGKLDQAEFAYRELLAVDPLAPAPEGAAPRIRKAFEGAKEKLYPRDYVRLQRLPGPVDRLELKVIDPWQQVADVELVDLDSGERTLLARDGELARGAVPSPLPGVVRRLELRAHDPAGAVVARVQPEAVGLVLTGPELTGVAREAPRGPLVPRWVAYVAAGAAVVAAAVGAGLEVSAQNASRAAGEARFASDTAALDAQAKGQGQGATVAFAVAGGVGGAAAVLFGLSF